MDAEERELVAQANQPGEAAQAAADGAVQAAAGEAVDEGDAMDLEDEDPSQMTIVRNYQRQDPRWVERYTMLTRVATLPCSL